MDVTLQDFPREPSLFELISRFCNTNDTVDINHTNVVFLYHVSKYVEMSSNHVFGFGRSNLIDRTDKFFEGIDLWTWSELLLALQYGQFMLININYVSSIHKLVDEVVERLALHCVTTTSSSSSSKYSDFRSSCDSKSTTQSNKSCYFRKFWWFEDLSTLDIDLIEMLVKKMVLKKFDNCTICKFLFYYQRVRVFGASKELRGKIVQKLINLLVILDKRSISIKGLFETLRVSSNLKLRSSYKSKLEFLIGSGLDQAVLDDLLFPSRVGKKYTKYNVNIVLSFLKNFLLEGNLSHILCSYRLEKVAKLVDLYACEIAPDHRLKPSKFIALIRVIPDSARDSQEKLYQAIEIFLEAHPRLNEEQKMKVCDVLNYNKLTPRVLNLISNNPSFPLITIVRALIHSKKLRSSINYVQRLESFKKSRFNYNNNGYEILNRMYKDEVFLKELVRNEKIRAHPQEIGWTLVELDNISDELLLEAQKSTHVCCGQSSIKYLPKLCS